MLTEAQLARQDEVDNTIYQMLCNLANQDLPWNIEHIGQVRDAIQDVLVDGVHVASPMDFYPYLVEDGDAQSSAEDVARLEAVVEAYHDLHERACSIGPSNGFFCCACQTTITSESETNRPDPYHPAIVQHRDCPKLLQERQARDGRYYPNISYFRVRDGRYVVSIEKGK